MPSEGQWRVLHLQQDVLPTLLIRAAFSKTGYEVHLSDFSNVWSQYSSRLDIIRQALNSECAIDPSEDACQMTVLLGKIKSALNQEDGTEINLQSKSDLDSNGLRMQLSVPLPSPLPALEWVLDLQQLPPQHVGAELVNPLLVEADLLRRQMQQLISELLDKDRVISKLSERLETCGYDLTVVFPGSSNVKISRKKPQRDQLARHVKGLADFDETEWRFRKAEESVGRILPPQAMESVLAQLTTPEMPVHIEDASIDWWKGLGRVTPFSRLTSRAKSDTEQVQRALPEDDPRESEDGHQESAFQRQQTPPGLRKVSDRPSPDLLMNTVSERAVNGHNADESTEGEDEDDLDAPLRELATSSQTLQKGSQMSAKSGSESALPGPVNKPQEAAAVSPLAKTRKFGVCGGRSATPKSLIARDDGNPPVEVVADIASAKAAPTKAKFGTIGGKSKPTATETSDPSTASVPTIPPKGPKLGTIGGKKRGATGSPSAAPSVAHDTVNKQADGESTDHARSIRKQSTPPAPRETSQERADRRREQLKKELEERAKAPAKKKRKF